MNFIYKFEMHPFTQVGCIVSIYGTQARSENREAPYRTALYFERCQKWRDVLWVRPAYAYSQDLLHPSVHHPAFARKPYSNR